MCCAYVWLILLFDGSLPLDPTGWSGITVSNQVRLGLTLRLSGIVCHYLLLYRGYVQCIRLVHLLLESSIPLDPTGLFKNCWVQTNDTNNLIIATLLTYFVLSTFDLRQCHSN